jgi:uncharacterized protein YegP (UPF0339 family)
MRKVLVCALMIAAMAAFTGVNTTPTMAQATKKDKDSKKAKDAKPAGVIEIAEGKDDKFRFFVRNAEGKLLAMSSPGGFATEKDAKEAIDDLKEVISSAKVTTKKPDKDGK